MLKRMGSCQGLHASPERPHTTPWHLQLQYLAHGNDAGIVFQDEKDGDNIDGDHHDGDDDKDRDDADGDMMITRMTKKIRMRTPANKKTKTHTKTKKKNMQTKKKTKPKTKTNKTTKTLLHIPVIT